ncbi:hypothetical protein ACFWFF_08395 [Streptomyces sp. NPDC060223]|uniref:hypothetical protein n=1 Tax=unclassified Streptomyces TaxID=2593676 RepID=UPI00363B45BE
MQRVEFLNYPASEQPAHLLWGIRIDGTDLRVHTADATRELWRPELEDETEAEQAHFLLRQHDGLYVSEVSDPVRHFLGAPAAEFVGFGAETTPVLGCFCGLWGCWCLLTVITSAPDIVTWFPFRQPDREQWGELPMGPYVFARPAYEAALAAPTRLSEDPLGPGLASLEAEIAAEIA